MAILPLRPRAFSVAELTVTALVVLLLSAIATVTWFGMRDRGEDSLAQTALNNLEIVQRFQVRDYGRYITSPPALSSVEPSYTYVGPDTPLQPDSEGVVSIGPDGAGVAMAAMSRSGMCYSIVLPHPDSGGDAVTNMWHVDEADHNTACNAATAVQRKPSPTPWGVDR